MAPRQLPTSPGHVFYEKLNGLLAGAGFDEWVESLCEPHYAKAARPGIPPRVYFRMLLVGYFEGIGSQRGIAWRCSDSLYLGKSWEWPQLRSLPSIRRTEMRDRLASIKLQLEALDRSHDETTELASKVFELSQTLRQQWLTADATKRRLLEIVFLNCRLDDVNLVPTIRKPFDVLAEGLLSTTSRGDGI